MLFEQYLANQYIIALIVFLGVFFILELLFFIIKNILGRFAKKTKTNLDNIISGKFIIPANLIIFSISLNLTLSYISLTESVISLANKISYSIILISVGYIIYIFIGVVVLRAWSRFARKTRLDGNLISMINIALRIAIIIIVLLYILELWGFQIGPLLAGLGIAGIAIALALQPALSNIFSGISMILDKSVRAGDLVYLDQQTKGKILKVGLRSTRILTFDNELIIVPNTKLAESVIQNIALPEPKSRVVIPFSVAYGSNIEEVKKIILKEINSIKNFCKDPGPLVRFIEMADSSLNFKAYFYVDSFENRFEAIDEANTKIYNALNKNKIFIPFPQMDIHLKKK